MDAINITFKQAKAIIEKMGNVELTLSGEERFFGTATFSVVSVPSIKFSVDFVSSSEIFELTLVAKVKVIDERVIKEL